MLCNRWQAFRGIRGRFGVEYAHSLNQAEKTMSTFDGHGSESVWSRDHLRLFYREFGERQAERTPVLCLPGLTRNSKDFIELAAHLSTHRRVVCPDLRGRGQSDHDPDLTRYQLQTYLEDIWELLAVTDMPRVVVIGTSLGGLLAMMMAAARPETVAGVVLNDIGPEIAPTGLRRISNYVGTLLAVGSWAEAIAQCKIVYGLSLPNLTEIEWVRFTRRQYSENAQGQIHLEYDLKLGDALRRFGGVPEHAWALYGTLKGVPTLAFRGALSDILSPEVFDRMAMLKPDLMQVVVPNRGHVPLLNEPECQTALDAFFTTF